MRPANKTNPRPLVAPIKYLCNTTRCKIKRLCLHAQEHDRRAECLGFNCDKDAQSDCCIITKAQGEEYVQK